jgi:mono/diheme cytochrome c family protein
MQTTRSLAGILQCACAFLAFATVSVRLQAQGPSDNTWVAPTRAAQRANPIAVTPEVLKRGHDLFHRECEQCHGKLGHGDGPQGLTLNPRPADLASERIQSQSDGSMFWKMTEGKGVMPKAPLGENEKWSVINYLRTLAAKH